MAVKIKAQTTVIHAKNEVIKARIGTVTIWTVCGILVGFQGGKHQRPIVWSGKSASVSVAEYCIDMVDGRQGSRYNLKDFHKLFEVVLLAHDLL